MLKSWSAHYLAAFTCLCIPIPSVLAVPADASGGSLPEGVKRVSAAELKIEREYITAGSLNRPVPQGSVDVNPPWLHVAVQLLTGDEKTSQEKKKRKAAQKWNRRFYFRLSQDPELKKGVIESGAKRWSFFNPYRRLESGTWYWTYGVAPAESPNKPVWCAQTFSFNISGKEYAAEIPPTPEAFVAAIKKRKTGPLIVCFPEEMGHILPTKEDPKLAAQIMGDCEKAFQAVSAKPVGTAKSKDAVAGAKTPQTLLERKQASSAALVESRRIYSLLRGYMFSGDTKYKDLALSILAKSEPPAGGVPKEYTYAQTVSGGKPLLNDLDLILVDVLYNEMPPHEQFKHAQALYRVICDEGSRSPDLHDSLEHALYDNHAWQGGVPALFKASIALSRINSEFDEWVKYAYELYMYRSPAFSRTDGGSSEGNGYLGVHENSLISIPWFLYKLTGYNQYKNTRWFQNFARYLTFSKPPGNPGISFEDSGADGGAGMEYMSDMLARMCPENPANLWLSKISDRRGDRYFSADLNKGSKAWDMLVAWSRLPEPDLSGAKPPSEKAAAFGDVGLVVMHTDITKAANNMMLNFRAGPYGSEGHTHPAQNAFTLAYGGEQLFWRTGYYNGGGLHNVYSYKCSRAHNTIMADGLVQSFHQSAYAWIARFATGEKLSYTLGDASHAYVPTHHYFSIPYRPDLQAGKVEMRRNWKEAIPANGFGDAGVTRFRRHMVMLRPHHVLIYDELEAKKPITWTFQLHSQVEMQRLGESWFKTANKHALGTAKLFCATPVKGAITDQFKGIPVDEENKRNGQNPPNWHATITTQDRLPATRFLTVLEVTPGKGLSAVPVDLTSQGKGRSQIRVGDYVVTAELDPSKPSFLEVHDNAGTCSLVTGQASQQIALGAQSRNAATPGSTMLWESKAGGGDLFVEKVDELPDCLKFGNPY